MIIVILLKKTKITISGDDAREGLACVLSVKIPDPKFSSQTKDKLVSSEIRPFVESTAYQKLLEWFDENPAHAKAIISKSIEAATAREAARKAREINKTKNCSRSFQSPGKNWLIVKKKIQLCQNYLL